VFSVMLPCGVIRRRERLRWSDRMPIRHALFRHPARRVLPAWQGRRRRAPSAGQRPPFMWHAGPAVWCDSAAQSIKSINSQGRTRTLSFPSSRRPGVKDDQVRADLGRGAESSTHIVLGRSVPVAAFVEPEEAQVSDPCRSLM
jgi:hypothetical protein